MSRQQLNESTIAMLKQNPHYKPTPGQYVPDTQESKKEEEQVRPFGVTPVQNASTPKTYSAVKKHKNKKPIDK